MLGVQNGDVKLFDGQILQSLREYLVDIARPAHGRTFLPFFRRHPAPELQRGMDTNRTSRSHAPYARQRRHWLGRQQPQ
jgi:hypothetical protein